MTTRRVLAIAAIYILATVAWATLGTSILARTGEFDSRLGTEVAQLWGGQHRQVAPTVWVERCARSHRTGADGVMRREARSTRRSRRTSRPRPGAADAEPRQGRPGAHPSSEGTALVRHVRRPVFAAASWPATRTRSSARLGVELRFPSAQAIYDEFAFPRERRSGAAGERSDQGTAHARSRYRQAAKSTIDVAYKSRGLDDWRYAFVADGVGEVSDFDLIGDNTNFVKVDFPPGSMSPTAKRPTRRRLGARVEVRQPGHRPAHRHRPAEPDQSRTARRAPHRLRSSLAALLSHRHGDPRRPQRPESPSGELRLPLGGVLRISPAAGLSGRPHLDSRGVLIAASLVSVFLVVSYLRVVVGTRFAIAQAGLAQFVFLVLFSYAFFFEGYTGLTVTVGAILTLFVMMQATARVDWGAVFAQRTEREA